MFRGAKQVVRAGQPGGAVSAEVQPQAYLTFVGSSTSRGSRWR
jgi:hypothetical protein